LNQEGIDISARDNDDRTPLHLAAQNGHTAVMEVLLNQEGIDISARDNDYRTPLHLAAHNGHKAVVEILLNQEGIDISARDNDDRTPLHLYLLSQEGINTGYYGDPTVDANTPCRDCQCDNAGSTSNVCNDADGQCKCKNNVVGLKCDECRPGFFNFPNCDQPCQCNDHADSCHPETGVCNGCQFNTQGDHCDLCIAGYYGHPTVDANTPCTDCQCDSRGSTSTVCNDDGQCNCKNNVVGLKCDECRPGFFNFPNCGFDLDAVLIVGGYNGRRLASGEVLRPGGKQRECFIPSLPNGGSYEGVMILTPGDHKVLRCGGSGSSYERLCLELDVQNGAWKEHSTLPGEAYRNGVTLANGVYLFSESAIYFLPRLSRSWQEIELEHTLPRSIEYCVVKTSETGFHLIGQTSWKYDSLTNSWTKLESLGLHADAYFACAMINNKIIVTGGYNRGDVSTTQVIPLTNGNVAGPARSVGDMNLRRPDHRMAVVGGKYPRLMVLGGGDGFRSYHRSVEVWQPDEEKWEMAPYEMATAREDFGILAVPDALVCQN